jgi:hypothetical protein
MKLGWQAERQALATVRRFNAANGKAWFWPKIAAALVSRHHWPREAAQPGGVAAGGSS